MSNVHVGYSYDDVLLVPRFSRLESRNDISLAHRLGPIFMTNPIISAPMDTVTELDMTLFMMKLGSMGVIHRYMDAADQANLTHIALEHYPTGTVAAAIGIDGWRDRASRLYDEGVGCLVMDVGHGDSINVLNVIEGVKQHFDVPIMSGNICTEEAAERAVQAGADILRVGVGAGSACTTRMVAGVGVPQITAIAAVRAGAKGLPIVADGGIKHSGDIVKALAVGANAVMLGGRLAGYTIAPKEGHFRGMASRDARLDHKPGSAPTPEGESFIAPVIHEYERDFLEMLGGIEHGLAYLGVSSIHELHNTEIEWMAVTSNGSKEGRPHFVEWQRD